MFDRNERRWALCFVVSFGGCNASFAGFIPLFIKKEGRGGEGGGQDRRVALGWQRGGAPHGDPFRPFVPPAPPSPATFSHPQPPRESG